MLSLKYIRENPDLVKQTMQNKNVDFDLNKLISKDDTRTIYYIRSRSFESKKK